MVLIVKELKSLQPDVSQFLKDQHEFIPASESIQPAACV
jgi:hypothetical protein